MSDMFFPALCICGHEIELHENEYGACLGESCLCCLFEPKTEIDIEPGQMPGTVFVSKLGVDHVGQVIGLAPPLWAGQCFGIALAVVEAGLVDGRARYGHWLGPVAPGTLFSRRPLVPHGWIEKAAGIIVDPTRWVFESVSPYIYEGPNDHYDVGGNAWHMANLTPPPDWNEAEPQKHYPLPRHVVAHIALLLHYPDLVSHTTLATLSLGQRFWLLNLPLVLLEPYTRAVFQAAVMAGDAALIPIDNRNLVLF